MGNFASGKSRKGKEAEADWESLMRCKTSISNRLIFKSKFLAPFYFYLLTFLTSLLEYNCFTMLC